MQYKVGIIGHFGGNHPFFDGQTVKTRIVAAELEKELGHNSVLCIDTYGWRKHPIKLVIQTLRGLYSCKNMIMMTDEGGIKVFPVLLLGANVFSKCRLNYVVIGGWLVRVLGKYPVLAACLKRFDGLFVETRIMKTGLEELGFSNVTIMPNCKPLTKLEPDELCVSGEEPHRLCTFSRVMKEKGIEDAVQAVCAVNRAVGRTVYTLDIYGQVDAGQMEWFDDLVQGFPSEVRYCGIVPFDQSVEILKDYFALLFPTHFYTEGIPGTIIDAYCAGVPVIAAQWESVADILEYGITGLSYPLGQEECLRELLLGVVADPSRINGMKEACLARAGDYQPERVIHILLETLE